MPVVKKIISLPFLGFKILVPTNDKEIRHCFEKERLSPILESKCIILCYFVKVQTPLIAISNTTLISYM